MLKTDLMEFLLVSKLPLEILSNKINKNEEDETTNTSRMIHFLEEKPYAWRVSEKHRSKNMLRYRKYIRKNYNFSIRSGKS